MCSAVVDKATGTPLPTRKSIRQLRWFQASFRARMAAISAQTGVQYHLSDRQMIDTFLAWHRAFDSQKPASRMVRRDYVGFAAGMMFHELLRKRPVSVRRGSVARDDTIPALTHPEVYLYASYCHVIRQAILGQDFWLDPHMPDRLDDPEIWNEYSDGLAQDRAAAIEFLTLFTNETRAIKFPKMVKSEGGFGKRLWTLAQQQANADTGPVAKASTPRLRLVSDRTPRPLIRLSASCRLVLIAFEGVAVKTDVIDSEELSILLREHNVQMTPEETRERFFGQPVSAAMTVVAERTGQLCPGGFLAQLDQRLIKRDQRDLAPMPGIDAFIQRIRETGRDIAMVSHGRARRVGAAQSLPALAMLRAIGPVHMLDPEGGPENGLRQVANALGHAPQNAVLIDASAVGIGMARQLMMPAYGLVRQDRVTERYALNCAGARSVIGDLDILGG
ncbi:HAD family phosphatase [Oceaniglobus ichthyenteri]|uniref:HAD family phosphatase n=1 Tax=Oceaniglobus ichthyenteri TaxID=2136177 RepID=UPI000F832F90|nr:HAD family phosphatase [Oceaniglobus ichthyenteri]